MVLHHLQDKIKSFEKSICLSIQQSYHLKHQSANNMYTHTHPSLPILKYLLYSEGARLSPTFLPCFSLIKSLLCVPQKLRIQLKYFLMSKFLLGPSKVGYFRPCIPLYNMIFYSISEFITLLLNMCSYISLSHTHTHTHTHLSCPPLPSPLFQSLHSLFSSSLIVIDPFKGIDGTNRHI